MRIKDTVKQAEDIVRALLILKRLNTHDRWTRQDVERYQQQRLDALVRYAVQHSPFYREFYSGIRTDHPINIQDLPILNKKLLMANWNKIVTDPRLHLADLQDYQERVKDDQYFLDEYRVLTTAGSSGLKGVFVFNRREWSATMAATLRSATLSGIRPSFPRRLRVATIAAGSALHATYRLAMTLGVFLVNQRRLDATAPIEELVRELNEFQPEVIEAYPSSAALLAVEQLEGRLKINPRAVMTFSEVRTPDMQQKMQAAWGIMPFNAYGLTEAIIGADCSFHDGIHVLEDLSILEVVDENNQPVPDGAPGQKVLLTNLFKTSQPLIRYEISDMLTLTAEPCLSGLPFRRITAIEGRSDDVLYLPGRDGRAVAVHPINFRSPLEGLPEIKQFQVIYETNGLHVRVVPRADATEAAIRDKLRDIFSAKLEPLGATLPPLQVHLEERISGDPKNMGKLKLVISHVGKADVEQQAVAHG